MRGKKNGFENYVNYYIDPEMDFDKRAPMGFQGMRGKRSVGRRFETDMDFGSLNEYQGKVNAAYMRSVSDNKERKI